ncbi:RNA-directed DNA polymerase from mobile element jockey [Araneus ventricosus]|uniref:RNA-directed DNA polymerase from mobile element jockey n=1 Tax=Araneus ventricosus TaxID=182803 RepID=A0A4Y2S554_ARAVE|nr:RNA-directed DNA polymerase from mobile element jockey [Araneus ventricosus]
MSPNNTLVDRNSSRTFFNHISSFAVSQILKNPASIDERVTDFCLAVLHETGAFPQKTTCPPTEILSSVQDANSVSEYAVREISAMFPMSISSSVSSLAVLYCSNSGCVEIFDKEILETVNSTSDDEPELLVSDSSYSGSSVPKAWKTAVVAPFLKAGKDPTQPENYRPISLLSTLILDKLNEHLAENKILCPEQFGFRKSLTTTHQRLRAVEYITSGFEEGECTGAVFLDVQKAFDRVWIQGLIHKLIRHKTPPHLLQLLKSYLEERKFAVKIGNSISEAKIMRSGIPQGGKISPVFYSPYVNDIPKTHKTLSGMYADDTAILAKNKNHKYTAAALNQRLAKLDDWFLRWKIAFNVNKTEAVYFAKDRRKHKSIVKNKNQTITWSQQAKYLGVILDEKLTCKNHITTIKTKFRAAPRKRFPLIARDSEINRKYKLLVYTAILRPIITYRCPIWGAAANSKIRMLEILENNIIRLICKAGWYMRNEDIRNAIKLISLKEFIKKISAKFYHNLDNIDNEAIQQLENYSPDPKSKRPRKILL